MYGELPRAAGFESAYEREGQRGRLSARMVGSRSEEWRSGKGSKRFAELEEHSARRTLLGKKGARGEGIRREKRVLGERGQRRWSAMSAPQTGAADVRGRAR